MFIANKGIADSYAAALYQDAKAIGAIEVIREELSDISSVFSRDSVINKFLCNRIVDFSLKREALQKAIGDKIHNLLYKYLLLVVRNRRVDILDSVVKCFNGFYARDKGVSEIFVVTAQQICDEGLKLLRDALVASDQQDNVLIYNEVKPCIIGGIIVYIGALTLDMSEKTMLRKFRDGLDDYLSDVDFVDELYN